MIRFREATPESFAWMGKGNSGRISFMMMIRDENFLVPVI
jgi:hypothetical protein